MKGTLVYRTLLVVGLLIISALYLFPTFLPEAAKPWEAYLPSSRIRLGLDLQGGTHLVLTVDVQKALENSLGHTAEDIKKESADAKIALDTIEAKGLRIFAHVANPESRGALTDLLKDRFGNLTVIDTTGEGAGTKFELGLTKQEERHLREFAVDQSIETIRNRIDQFGVTEPVIQRQGDEDIVVQLPGIQDPQRAKELIGKTALLEFKLLSETPPDEYTSGKKPVPAGTEILSGTANDRVAGRAERAKYLVETKTLMTGDVIANALVRPGSDFEGPYVALEFNARGATQFDELTGRSVGRRLAIVLDNTVYSAPVIRERIGGGHASISGSFEIKEARDLAIILRAGALPAPVHIAEERTVGPSLGLDSIRQGYTSFIVGGLLVVVFMLVYYKFAGVLADMALILNVIFLLAALAAFGATMTLPGIAAIVLTLGMAVDANVLINERIREELRLGKTPRAAIEAGYERALPAILDSGVTTFLSGIILFQFGSGPVKGFAVSLCIGLITTIFTAVICTRIVYDWMMARGPIQSISI